MDMYRPDNDILQTVTGYYGGGLNVMPLCLDGTRKPRVCKWPTYSASLDKRLKWFTPQDPSGIGIICGKTSGNLEVLDFDSPDIFPQWAELQDSRLLALLPIVETPKGGRHVYYRCETIAGNIVLALKPCGKKPLIETRGQGGMAVAPGGPLSVHPTGKPYKLIQGELSRVPWITPKQRGMMFKTATGFNQFVCEPKPKPASLSQCLTLPAMSEHRRMLQDLYGITIEPSQRPGDRFNAVAQWPDILEPHGWSIESVRGETIYWQKPHSTGSEHHATTNHKGSGLLYIFSTSVSVFEPNRGYSKFSAYALLNHQGDFKRASKAAQALLNEQPFLIRGG